MQLDASELARLSTDIESAVSAAGSPWDRLQAVCALLAERVPRYHWVGFYLADPSGARELVLGPYVGEPTEHVRIPFGVGICGQAAEKRVTLVVPDVSREHNYLACSPRVKSEIVVPVLFGGSLVGELDIDSHEPAAFGDEDSEFLEQIAARVGPLCAQAARADYNHRWNSDAPGES